MSSSSSLVVQKKRPKSGKNKKTRAALANAFRQMRVVETAGGMAGPLGAAIGKKIDRALQKKIRGRGSYMIGRGSYDLSSSINGTNASATILGGGNSHPRLTTMSNENGSITLSKREFVGSVAASGSADWSNSLFSINPGLSAVFPWGSQIAPNYQEYTMIQCVFTYEPVVSAMSVSAVGSLGSIVLSTNANAGAAKYDSFTAAIESGNSVRGTIANTIVLGIECDPNKASVTKFVRGGAVPSGQDIKTYDLATFQVGLYGVPTNYTVGTQLGLLWVDYTVQLTKPLFYDGAGLSINTDWVCSTIPPTLPTAVAPFGTTLLKHPSNSIGGFITNTGTAARYVFPNDFSGNVILEFLSVGTGLIGLITTQAPGVASWSAEMSDSGAPTSFTLASSSLKNLYMKGLVVRATSTPDANWIEFKFTSVTTITLCSLKVYMANPAVAGMPNSGIPA